MSQAGPCGRDTPRWSVLPAQPGTVAGMALTAGLFDASAMVWVGPPLDASAPRPGLVLFSEWLAAEKPHEVPESMLYPPSTMAGEPLQLLPPPRPLATMLSLTVMGEPVVKLCRLAPKGELLADKVDHEMVAVPKFWTAPPPFVPAGVAGERAVGDVHGGVVVDRAAAGAASRDVPAERVAGQVGRPVRGHHGAAAEDGRCVAGEGAVGHGRGPGGALVEDAAALLGRVTGERGLSDTVSGPLLLIAPPEVPVAAGEELPLNVARVTVSEPRLKIAPPPLTPSSARPLLSVTEFSVRLPPDATSKIRNAAVPAAADLVMVAPLPWMLTCPAMTGRPVPPSVVLFADVRV